MPIPPAAPDPRVVMAREGQVANLTLDDSLSVTGQSQGLLKMLDTPVNVFLGGGPHVDTMTGGRFTAGLRGCLHSVVLAGRKVDFKNDPLRTANIVPCSE